jgi:uncharacterized surface protein with fasciclin (FAS1) repeats
MLIDFALLLGGHMPNVTKLHDIVGTLEALGSYAVLVKCLRATGAIDTLRAEDREFTLFAPSDRAFKTLVPGGGLKALLDDHARLAAVINYHILPRRIMSRHADGRPMIRTLEGDPVVIDASAGLRVNGIEVTCPDIECSNGVVHEIAGVLMPGQRVP